jgi:hypothetical protein
MRRAFLYGNSRSLMTAFVILAALATSLALLFLSTKPATAQGEATSGTTVKESGDRLEPKTHCFICDAIVERTPANLNFGKVKKNRTKRNDVTVRGIQLGATFGIDFPAGVDTPSISGSDAGVYSITNNGCNNAELDPGEVCLITISFKPPRKGLFDDATLTIPTLARTQFQGGNTVELSGRGVKKVRR